MFTITGFKKKIEDLVGQDVEIKELARAIEAAKSDVVANHLLMGKDVTAEQFDMVVASCVKLRRNV